MRVGVPGEFHEDRWQRTEGDSERHVLPRTREVCGTHRIQVISWQSVPLAGLRHGDPAYRYFRAIPAGANQKKTDFICISKESEGPAPDTLDETLPRKTGGTLCNAA